MGASAAGNGVVKPAFVNSGQDDIIRYLVGDDRGRLHLMMSLARDGDCLAILLSLDTINQAAASSSLTYLGGGHVYLGSTFGNSQFARILDAPAELGTASGGNGGTKAGPLANTTYTSR